MSLTDEQRKIIIDLELERSDKMMSQIPALQELGFWDTIANRLYYALFHAVTAMFIYDGLEVSTHRGMVRNFGVHYVQTELFSREEGRFYSQLQTQREQADYNCKYDSTEDTIKPIKDKTEALIEHIKSYIAK